MKAICENPPILNFFKNIYQHGIYYYVWLISTYKNDPLVFIRQ